VNVIVSKEPLIPPVLDKTSNVCDVVIPEIVKVPSIVVVPITCILPVGNTNNVAVFKTFKSQLIIISVVTFVLVVTLTFPEYVH